MTTPQLESARRLLCSLQDHIRDTLATARNRDASRFARVAAVTAADTIYHVDKLSEEAILAWFERYWPSAWPVELVMEGLESEDVTFPRGVLPRKTIWKCLLDPIDGTRNLMYDKRSAWALGALAVQRGPRTNLRDIVVAAMTELPTSKHARADQFSAIRGCGRKGLRSETLDLRTGRRRKISVSPSRATEFKHGFASLVKFFPAGKSLTAQLEEALWRELHGDAPENAQNVFDDQYLSTGGQLYELLVGHDRLIADLRPLVFAKLGISAALACHPYDICVELILREAGGVAERPEGGDLRAPLDTTTPVAWIGYANPALAQKARPVLRRLIREML